MKNVQNSLANSCFGVIRFRWLETFAARISESLYFPKHHHMENNCFEIEKINRKINKTRINLTNCSATSEDCSEFFCFVQNKYRKVYNFRDTIKRK